SRVSNVYGPHKCSDIVLFLLAFCLYFSGLSLVTTRKFLISIKGAIQSSPLSISPSMLLSLFTTVQVQQPNRLFPQLGVVSSITKGQSPAFAFLYNVINSLFVPPQGGGT